MKRVAIIAGGDSNENQVSLRSADGLMKFIPDSSFEKYLVTIVRQEWYVHLADGSKCEIDKNDFSFLLGGEKIVFDFAYITIHGTPGENGILQGYFRLMDIPFSCCDVLPSALTFDKFICNRYLSTFGINVAPSIVLRKGDSVTNGALIDKVGLPCFIKPNGGGSSFGVTKVTREDQIQDAIRKSFAEDDEVIIEAFVDGIEVTCGLYRSKGEFVVFPITEVVTDNEFFDYNAKYNGEVEEITPARVSDAITKAVQQTSVEVYKALNAKGIIRVDYILSPEGEIFMLEVNTTPGMTTTSFIPQQIRAAGLDIADVMSEIIENEIAVRRNK